MQTARALEERGQILAVHELHRKEDRVAGFADVEDPAHRRVRDLPREPHLLKDASAVRRAGRVDQLERDRRLEDQVVGSPHVAHAAAADARNHPVAAGEQVAGRRKLPVSRLGRPPVFPPS